MDAMGWIYLHIYIYPGIPTTIKTMGVNITTIVYLRVLIIQIGSTIILMVVEAQGIYICIWKGRSELLPLMKRIVSFIESLSSPLRFNVWVVSLGGVDTPRHIC